MSGTSGHHQAPHLTPRLGQLPTTPRGKPHQEHGNNMATTNGRHRLEENPPRANNDGSHAPPHAALSTTNTGNAPFHKHPGHGDHCWHSLLGATTKRPRRDQHKLSG